jgi:hypothetical protein
MGIKRSQFQIKAPGLHPQLIADALTLNRKEWREIPVVEAPPEAPHYLVNLRSNKGHIWALGRRQPDGSCVRWPAPPGALRGLPQIFIV